MLVGDWDVPSRPVAWTAQGCDQSDLVVCGVRTCDTIVRAERLEDHLWLTHRIRYEPEADGAVAQ